MMINPRKQYPLLPYWGNGVSLGNFDTSTNWQELSGITTPKLLANKDWYWINSDSPANMIGGVSISNPATKFVLTLTGATAMSDLEDITSATIQGVNYLFGMDCGNNPNSANSRGTGIDMRVFRIVEPTITGSDISTTNFIEINCAFPAVNGPTLRDVESSFVDPVDGKLYIITKRDAIQRIYSLAYQATYTGTQTLVYEGTMTSLPESRTQALTTTPCYAVSACISHDGKDILVKNYSGIYWFPRTVGTDTVIQALQKSLVAVAYVGGGTFPSPKKSHPNAEPQGEGVCFDFEGVHYVTNSEYLASEGSTSTRYPLFKYERVSKSPTTVSFQDGVSGYTGTVTTYIWGTNPTTNRSAETSFVVDVTAGNPTDDRRGLLKFDLSSIPTTARIISAKLEMYIVAEGQGWAAYKMLVPWTGSSTYNSLGGGADNDGTKARVAESWRNGVNLDTIVNVTVLDNVLVSDIQEMVSNPSTNYGWLFKNTDTATGDGVQFASKVATTVSQRPKLTIQYV